MGKEGSLSLCVLKKSFLKGSYGTSLLFFNECSHNPQSFSLSFTYIFSRQENIITKVYLFFFSLITSIPSAQSMGDSDFSS